MTANTAPEPLASIGFSTEFRYDLPMLSLNPRNLKKNVDAKTLVDQSFPSRMLAVFAVLAWASLLPIPAWAHALHMFVSADGNVISGDVYYSDGKPARNATVIITAPGGETHEVTTGDNGLFAFTAAGVGPYAVVADSHDGHRVEQTVEVGEGPQESGTVATHDPPHAAEVPIATEPVAGAQSDAAVRAAVREEIRPLREELDRFQNTARMRDIIAGIGYIVGVFGLLAWIQARRRTRGDAP